MFFSASSHAALIYYKFVVFIQANKICVYLRSFCISFKIVFQKLASSRAYTLLVLLGLVFVNLVPDPLQSRVELVLHTVHVLHDIFHIISDQPFQVANLCN